MSSYFAGRLSKEMSAPLWRGAIWIRARLPKDDLLFAVSFTILLGCLGLPGRVQAQAQPAPQSLFRPPPLSAESLPPGSPGAGEELFAGKVHFRNGGPACASCHSIAGLPFPNGGTLGPDLSGVYHKLGPQGTQTAMQTLYFHVMTAIYDPHPLTVQERADLIAFFKQAATQPKPRWNTQIIVLIGFIGFLILLSITHFVWRDRLKSVRRAMVERATRQGGIHS
ncbi:MAG: c-type cytochrome [Terriglobia bacterium]